MRFIATLSFCLCFIGCQPNEAILKSTRSNTASIPKETLAPSKSTFEQELVDMRAAGFDYIFVLRRKDGREFDDEDRTFLRGSVPLEVNRRVAADNGRAFILGSGFAIDLKTIETWRKRFNVDEKSEAVEKVESKR
jgi:hypothetical protein